MENLTPTTTFMRLKISGMMEDDRASELRELEEYFNLLEEDRRRLQNLLQDQSEVHAMALKALERERIQEREEWEKVMQEREEALYSTFLSVAISRERLMKDLMSRQVSIVLHSRKTDERYDLPNLVSIFMSVFFILQSIVNLRETAGNPPTVTLDKQSRRWWCFRKRQTTPDVALKVKQLSFEHQF